MSGHPYKFGAHPYKVAYRRALGNASGGFGAIGVGSAQMSAPSACRVRKRWWAVRTVSRTGRVSGVSVVCSQDLVRSKAERMAEVNGPSSTFVTVDWSTFASPRIPENTDLFWEDQSVTANGEIE